MEPSPLPSRCLERGLLQELTEAEAERESDALDLLCLLSALAQHARLGEERFRAKKRDGARVADVLARFRQQAAHLLDDAALRAFGRECAGALVVPFSDHRKKGAAFMADTVAGFVPLAERLAPLWTPMLRASLLQAPETAPRLALECLALEACRRSPPSTRRNRRPDRVLFWSVAFLYAEADPQWDRKSAPPDIDDDATRLERTQMRELSDASERRMAAYARARTDLRRYRAEAPLEERFVADEMEAALLQCAPHRFQLSPAVLDAFEAHCAMVRALLDMLPPLVEEEAVEAPVAVPIAAPAAEEADAAPPAQIVFVAAAVIVDAPVASSSRREARRRAREAERLRVEECADVLQMARPPEEALQRASAVLLEEDEDDDVLVASSSAPPEEDNEDARARRSVLRQMSEGRLPLEFKRTVLSVLACGFHRLVEPELECFVCFAPIDLSETTGARFLMCCEGDFVCQACLQAGAFHRPADGHAVRTELFPVLQAREVRRELGLLLR